MGTSLYNFHVKGAALAEVKTALTDVTDALPAYVTRKNDNWVSVFPAEDHAIQHMAQAVSGALEVTAIAFHVSDGEYCEYWLYEEGDLADYHNTDPNLSDASPSFKWTDDEDEDEEGRSTTALLRHSEEASEDVIDAALTARWEHAEEAAVEIAGFLGIGPERAEYCYPMAEQGEAPPDDAVHIED